MDPMTKYDTMHNFHTAQPISDKTKAKIAGCSTFAVSAILSSYMQTNFMTALTISICVGGAVGIITYLYAKNVAQRTIPNEDYFDIQKQSKKQSQQIQTSFKLDCNNINQAANEKFKKMLADYERESEEQAKRIQNMTLEDLLNKKRI